MLYGLFVLFVMFEYCFCIFIVGCNMVGVCVLWCVIGMKDGDFYKLIIVIVNFFIQFVFGYVYLKDFGQLVVCEIEQVGGVVKEFNIIVVDDGIVMGYDGMLYLLFSCEIIVDVVEYMVNVYCVDVLVCISNCDKIIFGMLMVVLCLDILVVFVFGGLMEVGKIRLFEYKLDLVDVMVVVVDDSVFDEKVVVFECSVCFICGFCLGMFIVNLMNCLIEVLGLLLLGNGIMLVIYVDCEVLFCCVGCLIVEFCYCWYGGEDLSVLLCGIVIQVVFVNVMILDIVMGGFINIILYLLVVVQEVEVDFDLIYIDVLL